VLYVEISRYDALRWFPQGGIFGEVGVFKGDFSRKIIDVVAPKQLHLTSRISRLGQNRSIPMTAAILTGCLNASTRI
jgi:hypothetical protein